MKLKDLGDLIIFDAFPLAFNPNQKIFLTHLLHLEQQIFPQKLPMIYTTKGIADQLLKYCSNENYKCITKSNVFIIEPYNFIDIVIERRRTLQILFCSAEDVNSRNIIVLIKENGKLNYIYGGNFVDIRFALLNDTFANWIAHGVDKLYVNLKRTDENHIFNDIDQLQKVFNIMENIMDCHLEPEIHIYVPLFGYESFIFKLANIFPNRVAKTFTFDMFFDFLDKIPDPKDTKYFCEDDVAKIIIFPSTPHLDQIKFENSKVITINIINDRSKCTESEVNLNNAYYELFYSPEPSPFILKLLCMLVKPKRLYGIIDTFNNKSKVPQYLIELCVGAKEKMQKKQKRITNARKSSSSNAPPKTIIVGSTLFKMNHKNGAFLSETDSDNDQ